jgi:hypothetical protein
MRGRTTGRACPPRINLGILKYSMAKAWLGKMVNRVACQAVQR